MTNAGGPALKPTADRKAGRPSQAGLWVPALDRAFHFTPVALEGSLKRNCGCSCSEGRSKGQFGLLEK